MAREGGSLREQGAGMMRHAGGARSLLGDVVHKREPLERRAC
jgi:hypothetical protein